MPGQSTESEVRALMGPPSQALALPEGEKALFYSRLPEGRMVFVATIGADGRLREFEQRLTRLNIAKLVPGTSTKNDVLAFFGPPGNAGGYPRLEREWWEYKFFDYQDRRVLTVQFSPDGIVREVLDMRDWAFEPPGMGRPGKGHH
ncbi:MAG TPA: hypothetical protein VL180_02430 [Burkholderiales bacterium]|nr:hypothetical protein [Burkholderiales bacterium]